MYHSFADVQTAEMVKLDTPDVDKKVVTLKPSETVLRLADEIAERAERIHAGGVDIHVDNMLKVTSDGRKVALDPRVFDIACEDEHDSKVNECIERVYEIWEKTADNKGVQLIFCDQSTPKTVFKDYEYGKDFDVYNDIKFKLVERGIPAEEIAFIHDANTDGQKMALYKDANAGKVRVFIGSTEKCGAGMNVQQRLFALHHLDTPYRPLDLQQREGRIVRQGNGYKNVEIYTYVTERTFDSYSYQILENKQRFISQIERGDMTVREAEDIDEVTLSYAEIKAITAANPRIKRKMEVDTEIQRLRVLESEYRKSLYTTQDNVRKYFPEEIRRQTLYLENLRKDIETVKEKYNPDPEQFSINVLGKVYTDKTEGGRALMEALNSHRPETVVAEYAGFKISLNPMSMLMEERSVSLTGAGQYRMEIGDSEIGLLRRLANFMSEFSNREVGVVNKLSQLENNLRIAQEQLNVPFEHADELENLLKEQAELNAELDLNKHDEVVIDEQEDGETMSDDDEAYMGVPEKEERQPQRKKPRKPFGKSQKAIYEKVKAKSPDAYVFVNNGDRYEIMGDYTGEIGGTLEKGEYTVTSLNGQELDAAIRKLVENGETVKIIDEYEEIKEEESFIDEKDKVAEMEIEVMPDYSIDQDVMENCGYKWKGMLPLRSRAALRLMEMDFEIYKLNADNTEQQITDAQEIRNHSTEIFGIEKPTWKAFYESEKGRVYLSARRAMCESADYVASEELSYVDGKFIEPFIDVNYGEKKGLENYLKDKDDADINEQKQHVSALLSEFTSHIYGNDYLYEYGWTKYDVAKSLAENLKDEELSLVAEQKADEWELRAANDQETMKVANEKVVFFGNNGGTAYYYFKDKLSFDNETPRIMEEADEYVIAAPVCYLSQRELEEHNITFLKIGRDIDESVLNTDSESKARWEMEKAYNLKLPLEATIINGDCKRDIERYIRNHFNGMHLNVERFEEVINFYGMERVRYVLANTVQLGESDGRYNPFNKEWAKGVIINNDDQNRRLFNVESHPAVIDGLVTFFRRYEKEHPNWTRIDVADGYGNKVTLRPDLALPYFRDSIKGESYGLEVQLYEVVQEDGKDMLHPYATLTKSFDEFIGIKNAAYVDTNNCPFASQLLKRGIAKNTGFTKRSGRVEYPLWVFDENFLRQSGEEAYEKYAKQYEEKEKIKEGQEMPQNEKPKREWETVKVSQNALIKKYKNHSFMRMPTGYYGDCTYNVYNDRITRSTQITDLQSDSRELCFELRFDKNEDVILKDQNNDEIVLSVEKFKEFVGGSTNADYVIKTSDGEESKWFTVSVPNDALAYMGEKASLFNLPNGSGLGKYAFYIPNAFVKEDTDSEEGRIELSMPSDLSITAKTRDGQEMNITPYQIYTLMDNTKAEQYVRESTKTEFEESKEKAEGKPSENGGWNYVSVHEKAKIAEYGDSTLFRMPTSGDYNGYAYFIPNKLLKANEEKGTIRIALPDGFVVKAQNNRAEKDEEKKVEVQAQDFVAMVKDKGADDYESYQKPSDEKAADVFSENEARLIENVPQEMKDRPNWVAVKSWWNEEKSKVEKRPINCNTGKYADILDPTTWTSFDKAREFAKENGYTTLAYALDGKDNICCIDLDGCLDENGKYSGLANELMTKCGKTYMEKSMSGKGLHIFDKTNGMDVRTFSKDGAMEFYQQDRFISMTGDGTAYKELESFDKFEVKTLISQKCEKRSDWKGQGQGVEGLSVMDDRDVVEKACADKKYGKTFKALYEGQDLRNNHSNSDMSLMNRLAFWCNGDKEQMLRIFATSGLYRPEKSASYYEGTAIKAVRDTTGRYNVQQSAPTAPKPVNNSGKGGK